MHSSAYLNTAVIAGPRKTIASHCEASPSRPDRLLDRLGAKSTFAKRHPWASSLQSSLVSQLACGDMYCRLITSAKWLILLVSGGTIKLLE